MKRLVSLFLFVLLSLAAFAQESAYNGQWMIDASRDPAKVQLTFRYSDPERSSDWGGWSSTWSNSTARTALPGLSEADLNSPGTKVAFQIVRDAGTFQCEGWAAKGSASGHFTFAPSQAFLNALRDRGFDTPTPRQQFHLALGDMHVSFIDELRKEGYAPFDIDVLVKFATHGITEQYVREMKAAGYPFHDAAELIKMRDHGVTPAYIGELKAAGFTNLSAEDVLRARDHGVSAEYLRAWKSSGYSNAGLDDFVRLRDHGVTPEFASTMSSLGYRDLAPRDLQRLRDHGVSADYAREADQAGFGRVGVDDLVRLRDHGVSIDFLQRHHTGYTIDSVIRLHDRGGIEMN